MWPTTSSVHSMGCSPETIPFFCKAGFTGIIQGSHGMTPSSCSLWTWSAAAVGVRHLQRQHVDVCIAAATSSPGEALEVCRPLPGRHFISGPEHAHKRINEQVHHQDCHITRWISLYLAHPSHLDTTLIFGPVFAFFLVHILCSVHSHCLCVKYNK